MHAHLRRVPSAFLRHVIAEPFARTIIMPQLDGGEPGSEPPSKHSFEWRKEVPRRRRSRNPIRKVEHPTVGSGPSRRPEVFCTKLKAIRSSATCL
ncbi:hypothetical protein U1Q18_008481 [Sarracenia purpurea var. burkii]